MGEIDRELLFEHKFTTDLSFRSHFDKLKCFRVMDEEGNIVNKGYDIDKAVLTKMYETMVTINEADQVFNAAQRQSRISFYMTQLGEEASNIGTASALESQDLLFP